MHHDGKQLSICVLGGFRVATSAGRSIDMPGRKAQALLGYLAAQPTCRERRERLAALLWGDRFHDQALHSLRQAVLVIRKALGEPAGRCVQSDAISVGLDPALVEIDLRRFESAATAEDAGGLQQAAALYGGDFLDDLSVNADPFTEWQARARERLRAMAAQVLLKLAEAHEREGRAEEAKSTVTRALEILPTLEEAHRLLIELLRREGNRSAALRQYRLCEEILREELDVVPDAETRSLAEAVRAGDRAASRRSPSRFGASALKRLPNGSAPKSWRRSGLALAATLVFAAGAALGIGLTRGINRAPDILPGAQSPSPRPDSNSIVVLPFENLGGNASHQLLVDGITEEITAALSIMPQLLVIARNTALAYRDRTVDLRKVAEELGVRYVVDGAIQVERERVRVLAHLVDAGDNRQIWAHRYETEMTGLFALQDEIALEIVTGLQVEMTEGEQVRVSLVHGTTNLQAWLTAGEALQHIRRLTRIDNARARELYERAVELDPSYPGAWDGLAWTHFIDARFGWTASAAGSLGQAASLAARTLALDPQRPGTYALLGGIALAQGRHAEAVSLAQQAVALSPNGADVTAILGLILTYTGEAERAAQFLQQAMRLSPRYPDWYRWALGRAYRLMGDGERAIAALASRDVAGDESIAPLIELAASYAQAGKIATAHTVARRVLVHHPAFSARAWTALPPYRDAAIAAQEHALLVSAGLPE